MELLFYGYSCLCHCLEDCPRTGRRRQSCGRMCRLGGRRIDLDDFKDGERIGSLTVAKPFKRRFNRALRKPLDRPRRCPEFPPTARSHGSFIRPPASPARIARSPRSGLAARRGSGAGCGRPLSAPAQIRRAVWCASPASAARRFRTSRTRCNAAAACLARNRFAPEDAAVPSADAHA
jgi:hypothetical protein